MGPCFLKPPAELFSESEGPHSNCPLRRVVAGEIREQGHPLHDRNPPFANFSPAHCRQKTANSLCVAQHIQQL